MAGLAQGSGTFQRLGKGTLRTLTFDVVIIGGGVVGACLARELSRYDRKVGLIEKEADVCFGTSKANSGIVHSGIHDQPGTLKAQLCVAGNRLYQSLAAELDILYKNNGSIVVAKDTGELTALAALHQNGLANGVTGLTLLNKEELLRMEPNFSPDLAGGLYAPSGGIVMPFDLVYGMVENAVANGLTLLTGSEAVKISLKKKELIVETGREIIQTGYLVNAAGLNSSIIAGMIGDKSFHVRPRKGEEYIMDRRLDGLVTRTIFPLPSEKSKGILIIPTVDGNLMIGPTATEVESAKDPATTSKGWEEIYSETKVLLPSLRQSDLITSFAGFRAISGRDDFIIKPSEVSRRLINVAGIMSPGLTAAPAIAQYTVELLKENGLPLRAKKNFNPLRKVIRWHGLSREARAELAARNPAYGNIICRCEQVTEGEIRDAIRRGATTLDGLKLRTRSGMGRCQGGFCTSRLIAILSEELGIPWEKITKKGPGSEMLMGRLRSEGGVTPDA